MQRRSRIAQVGIFYPSDPAGHVPSGIDSFIRGLFKWAPEDIEYTLIGASSDLAARPLGVACEIAPAGRGGHFVPIVPMDATARRGGVPLTIRYMSALQAWRRSGGLASFDVLDFHRIEPIVLFRGDGRPKNVVLHTDMSILRDPNCEIMWKHAPSVYEFVESRLFRAVDRIFSVRQSAVERYRKRFPELAERFLFTNTWVDTDVFRPEHDPDARGEARLALRAQIGAAPDARLVTFVGRLDKSKDPLLLLAAFAELRAREPRAHLVIVGDGILRGPIEALAASRGVTAQVSLLGARNGAFIAGLHRAADVFALSSAYEGMPIALLEALACGLPVASTRVGEVSRVVRDGETGFLSATRSAGDLAAALEAALGIGGDAQRRASVAAIDPHRPEAVLSALHDNHRRQFARLAA